MHLVFGTLKTSKKDFLDLSFSQPTKVDKEPKRHLHPKENGKCLLLFKA